MKKFINIISVCILTLMFYSCSAQNTTDSQTLNSLVTSEEFTFHAERANPMNYDIINTLNSIPNNPSTRILQLDAGSYTIELRKGKMKLFFLTSEEHLIQITEEITATDSLLKTILLQNLKVKKEIGFLKLNPMMSIMFQTSILKCTKNGKAFTSIRSNDRQPITYDGYISKNEEIKEKKID